jgi:hypothetical protein
VTDQFPRQREGLLDRLLCVQRDPGRDLPDEWHLDAGLLRPRGGTAGPVDRARPGVPFRWVSADEAYGDNGPLRGFLEKEEFPYVLAVARDHLVAASTGLRRVDILADAGAWHRLSCGNSAKGRRWYDWALNKT